MEKTEKEEILLESGTNELEIVEFGINSPDMKKNGLGIGSFGINVAKVREIIKIPNIISLPASHPSVRGVFNLRDKVIPLIDLGHWLQLEDDSQKQKDKKVIVAEFNQDYFGFLVSSVNRIHRVSWEEVESPNDQIFFNINNECITGLVKFEDRITLMLDFEKIVADINPKLSAQVSPEDVGEEPITEEVNALIAEDSVTIRNLLVKTLEAAGFKLIKTNNGKEAWNTIENVLLPLAKDNNQKINDVLHVVITDIEMPQMDGHHLTKKIKEHPDLKTLPVIIFSSLINEEMMRKGEAVGADDQISKPEIGNLVSVVYNLIRKYKKI